MQTTPETAYGWALLNRVIHEKMHHAQHSVTCINYSVGETVTVVRGYTIVEHIIALGVDLKLDE